MRYQNSTRFRSARVGLHVHACGGQKLVLGVGLQGLLALLFETGPSLGLGTCQLDQAAWMASSRYLPPSTPQH